MTDANDPTTAFTPHASPGPQGRQLAERSQAKRDLDEHTVRMLQNISDCVPTLLYVADLDTRELVFVNRQFERVFGLPSGEILAMGRQFNRRYLHPDDLRRWQLIAERFAAMEDQQNCEVEFRVKNAEGQWRWLHCWEVIFNRHPDGRARWILGSAVDVTQGKNTEDNLRVVRSAVEHIREAVLITDAQLDPPGPQIVYVNPAFEWLTGYSLDALRGLAPKSLGKTPIPRQTLDDFRQSLAAGKPFRGELTTAHAGTGEERTLQWHVTPLRGEQERITHWVSILRDITEEKQRQRMIRHHEEELAHVARLSTMGEMASGLAHELNQPLAAITNYVQGCIQRLHHENFDKDAIEEAMRRVATQAERAGQIIRRLRHFVDKHEPSRSNVNINEVIRDALALIDPSVKHEAVRIELDLQENLPILRVDGIQIEQVILNVVRNAIEAMNQVEPAQRQLAITSRLQEDHNLLVTIKDTGKGMTNAQLAHIFDPFFTTKDNGMGMGLNISQSIIHAHEGRLWASRNDKQGMTFHLSLPVEEGTSD